MYVESLRIENLRSFSKAEIGLLHPALRRRRGDEPLPRLRNVNVMLGINGSGKSTILDATALSLLSPLIASSGYRPYSLIRRSARGRIEEAAVKVDLALDEQDVWPDGPAAGKATMRVLIVRRGDVEFVQQGDVGAPQFERLFYDDSAAFFFVGYGATRRVDVESTADGATRRKLRHVRYERVASLFEDHFTLTPLSAWLPEWRHRNRRRHDEAIALLGALLPKSLRFTGRMENGEYLFAFHSTTVPFGALSDGYRAYIGWVSDLLQHLCIAVSREPELALQDCRGVVMVDEIDLHIHPEWQRTIIPTLARKLPNLQFLFTTHSPLVVGTLERANIHVVERRRGFPIIRRPDEEVFGLSADQILRSNLFGLDSTRDQSFKRKLDRLVRDAELGDAAAALAFMRGASRGAAAIVDEADAPLEKRRAAGKLAR
ncbi:MAG: AAA family ATPase [Alphaproteobacteria bacterium]|nr:AAA family ATPase [Alphaproteobacteria bacterium]